MHHDDQAHADPPTDLESVFERRDERAPGEATDLDRPAPLDQPIARRRAIGIGVAGIAAVLDPEQIGESLAAASVPQCEGSRRFDRDLDPMIHQRPPPASNGGAFAGRLSPGVRRCESEPRQPEARHRGRAERDPHVVHLVLIGVMARGVEPLGTDATVEQLHRHWTAVAGYELEGTEALALPWRPVSGSGETGETGGTGGTGGAGGTGGTNRHIAPEQGDVGDHHATAWARRRIPHHQRRSGGRGALACHVGIVSHQIVYAAANHLGGQRLDAGEAFVDGPRHGVTRAAGDRIVELAAHECPPGELDHGPPVAAAGATREAGKRLRYARQCELRRAIAPLERCSRAVHALERPSVAIGPA